MKPGIRGVVWVHKEDFEDARALMRRLTYDYLTKQILPILHKEGRYFMTLGFDNGDYWQIRFPCGGSRACYANISYIHHNIKDKKLINEIIKPATRLRPYNAIQYF
jgi:hypothetical protein